MEKQIQKKTKRHRIIFSFNAPGAGQVSLVGEFNKWDPVKHPMQRDENGTWNKRVMLSHGDHEYKFLVDGQWKEDPRNKRRCTNCFGSYNSIISLPEA